MANPTPNSAGNSGNVSRLCRIYRALLYGYPREFRLQYGGAMQQLFRDRCRDLARTPGRLSLFRFSLNLAADWLASIVRERIACVRVPSLSLEFLAQQARAIWSAGHKQAPRGLVAEWALTIIVYLFATTTLVQAYVVPTGSMEGSVMIGDHMLVDRVAFANPGGPGRHLLPYHDVQRGDIVVFLYPEDIRQTYVKRVIGLPGDRIRLVDKQVIRNGRRLMEPYTQHMAWPRDPYRDCFPIAPEASTTPRGRDMFQHHVIHGEVMVPPDSLFVLGDNRENSEDSRYWGFVPRGYVVGKPLIVYWSYDAPTAELEEWSLAHILDVTQHFFTKTRWERTLLVPRSQRAKEAGDAE
jgi:signal peptidase I